METQINISVPSHRCVVPLEDVISEQAELYRAFTMFACQLRT